MIMIKGSKMNRINRGNEILFNAIFFNHGFKCFIPDKKLYVQNFEELSEFVLSTKEDIYFSLHPRFDYLVNVNVKDFININTGDGYEWLPYTYDDNEIEAVTCFFLIIGKRDLEGLKKLKLEPSLTASCKDVILCFWVLDKPAPCCDLTKYIQFKLAKIYHSVIEDFTWGNSVLDASQSPYVRFPLQNFEVIETTDNLYAFDDIADMVMDKGALIFHSDLRKQ
jgi:hypothetical protein